MAKPSSASSSAASASSSTTSSSSRSQPQTQQRYRRTRTGSSRHNHTSPSSCLLAIIATVAASSSTADGFPIDTHAAPPDFLCPLLAADPTLDQPIPSTSYSIESREFSRSPRRPPSKRSKRPFVPADRYEQGTDGRWRKSSTWSLYGSAYCETSPCTQETSIPVVDDQVQELNSSSTSPTATATDTADPDMSSLPPGWNAKAKKEVFSNTVILTMSLVLAIVICALMICCITWRRRRRRALDIERRPSKKSLDDDSDDENDNTKKSRKQQRVWSKASARWKANVRLSARRRRAQRTVSTKETSITTRRSSISLNSIHTPSTSSLYLRPPESSDTPSPSPAPSIRPTLEAEDHAAPDDSGHRYNPPPSQSVHPPAYATKTYIAHSDNNAGTSHIPAHDGAPINHTQTPSHEENIQILYVPGSDAAHLATDDKTILARMAALTSAPPSGFSGPEENSTPGESSESSLQASVPIIEELEEPYEDHLDEDPDHVLHRVPSPMYGDKSESHSQVQPSVPSYQQHAPNSPFPAPPSKSTLAKSLFYEYPLSFEEDVIGTEPPVGPSAPPFDVAIAPSAPPFDFDPGLEHDQLAPCAPPLPEEDDTQNTGSGLTAQHHDSLTGVQFEEHDDPDALNPHSLRTGSCVRTTAQTEDGRSRRPPSYLP